MLNPQHNALYAYRIVFTPHYRTKKRRHYRLLPPVAARLQETHYNSTHTGRKKVRLALAQ